MKAPTTPKPKITHCPDCGRAYGPAGPKAHAGTCRMRPPSVASCTYCGRGVPTGRITEHWGHCPGLPRVDVPCRLCEGPGARALDG